MPIFTTIPWDCIIPNAMRISFVPYLKLHEIHMYKVNGIRIVIIIKYNLITCYK